VTFTFDLLTLNVVSESRVTWATSVQILVFLGLSILEGQLAGGGAKWRPSAQLVVVKN